MAEQQPPAAVVAAQPPAEPPAAQPPAEPPVDIEVYEKWEPPRPPEPPKQRAARAPAREEQPPEMDLDEIIETDPSTVGVQYDCAKCGFRQSLTKRGDVPVIMCANCGHRMLYKVRPRFLVQFAAR